MAAGVHGAVFGLKFQSGGLLNPQRIHVGPQQHAAASIRSGDVRRDAAGHIPGRIAQLCQALLDIGCCMGKHGTCLRIAVQRPAVRQKRGAQGLGFGQKRFCIDRHKKHFLYGN